MADTLEIGQNMFRGWSHGRDRFSSGRGLRAECIASRASLGIETSHGPAVGGAGRRHESCADWTGRVPVLGHIPCGSRRHRGMMQRSGQDERPHYGARHGIPADIST